MLVMGKPCNVVITAVKTSRTYTCFPLSIQLSKMKFATVREFKGRKMVDIREFYMTGEGELRPGKKGGCRQKSGISYPALQEGLV